MGAVRINLVFGNQYQKKNGNKPSGHPLPPGKKEENKRGLDDKEKDNAENNKDK
jgi:hypothetical protein